MEDWPGDVNYGKTVADHLVKSSHFTDAETEAQRIAKNAVRAETLAPGTGYGILLLPTTALFAQVLVDSRTAHISHTCVQVCRRGPRVNGCRAHSRPEIDTQLSSAPPDILLDHFSRTDG